MFASELKMPLGIETSWACLPNFSFAEKFQGKKKTVRKCLYFFLGKLLLIIFQNFMTVESRFSTFILMPSVLIA